MVDSPGLAGASGASGSGSDPAEGPAEAPVIRCDEPGSFARSVLAERHPALIERVRKAFPYGPAQHRALDALLEETAHGVIAPPPPGDDRDREQWEVWGKGHLGRLWFDAPFLWTESYFYRRLLGAVGYFGAGPWQGVDPFGPFKRAELGTPETEGELAAVEQLESKPQAERARALLLGSLWGNRADLGFLMGAGAAGQRTDEALVADDSAALWALLPALPVAPVLPALPAGTGAPPARTVCLVADNAGRELLPDLLLVDHFLRYGHAERIVLHVKSYPYFVSDATTADVVDCLRHLKGAGGAAGEAGRRLWDDMASGRIDVRAHPFSCAPLPYQDMPDDLRQDFAEATVTLMKGDLNYRRLVGDRMWPATTPFADRTAYFPGPVAALRTLKSDVLVGLAEGAEERLAARGGEGWRTSGTHALIQVGGVIPGRDCGM
ncbi:damage-control phosphatase ARMT1 family protein [Streptomyces sp. NPDC048442]|uniref:damage-control phosphatase ARMT1 family protein n=1 Tax=Streptomyces sp. NPDC048442 TaxID=3154823 RepID=UPI0034206B78